jgi:geranylgeranyl diphosphate synthase type II
MLRERAETDFVEAVLAADHQLIRDFIPRYLPTREPRKWLYDLVADYPARRGKGIRSSLCLASARAFGGRTEEALPSAIALDLLHNAFLVHDDVEDGSEQRRGSPTLHHEVGTPLAINAGDALAVLGLAPLKDNQRMLGSRMSRDVFNEFEALMHRTIEGQALELGWRADNVVELTPDDYLDLVMLKSCAYTTIYPLRIGARIGSWGAADLDAITTFGLYLGAAFQIHDDVLNLSGASGRYGKEALGDLYEGKRTLIIINVLGRTAGADHDFVVSFLSNDRAERTEPEVRRLMELIETTDSIAYARRYAETLAAASYDTFDDAFATAIPGRDKAFLRAMIPYMVERDL